jgi:zinc/manganese transport system substrate-binding protein
VSGAAAAAFGRRWLAIGFDASTTRAFGVRVELFDAVLLALVAFAVVAALSAVGALLTAALFVVPAATARLLVRSLRGLQLASVALVAVESVAGLWLSVELNVPPGPAISVLAGAVFVVAALVTRAGGRAAVVTVAVAALLTGCGTTTSGGGKLQVVATTTQIGDWARAVGGPYVAVHQILQPNTDPHEYEPRPRDVQAVADADVVLENGDGLDAWMDKVVSQSGGHPRVIVLGRTVPVKLPGEAAGPEPSRFDPHWWHDPRNAESAVARIGAGYVAADRAHRRAYARRGDAYRGRVEALDRTLAACFARTPRSERKLVTDHDAFNYFAHRYRIHVVGAVIPSQTTQAQPSAGEIARLVRLIRRERVRAIFPESSLNRSLVETIARETGARADFTLYGDTLGPPGSPGATYLGMERSNGNAMAQGFSGGRVSCR